MRFTSTTLLGVATLAASALAQGNGTSTTSSSIPQYTIQADGITAYLIPYGARITHLMVNDRSGQEQDIIAGYDDPDQYVRDTETNHTYFGAIVGRYANRIKNGTFEINGETYHVSTNEHGGEDTLHGGKVGYDARNWTVLAVNESSITFSLLDTAFEGFPGTVLNVVTWAVSSAATGPQGEMRPRLTVSITSNAIDQETPIMLSTHIYWALNAWKDQTANDTVLWMPYSDRYIEIDGIEVPTGGINTTASLPTIDFTSPKTIGDAVSGAQGLCGTGCTGVDNAFIVDRPRQVSQDGLLKTLSMWSNTTGIQLDVTTDQQGLQIYTCNGQNGTIPVPQSQMQRNGNSSGSAQYVNKYGCVVIEPQNWIDGINYPEWGVDKWQIFGPDTGAYTWYTQYDISTF